MKESIISLKVTHKADMTHLAEMIAGRAFCMSGVEGVEVVYVKPAEITELQKAGFSAGEIALGVSEVWRG